MGLPEVDFGPVRQESYDFCRRKERGKRKKEWSQLRDLIREERKPFVRSEARQLLLRSTCGLTRRISGSVWSSSSGELKGSQVVPEANVLLVSSMLDGSRENCQLGEPPEAVSYQRGFSLRDRP